jgi:hypothetical protein
MRALRVLVGVLALIEVSCGSPIEPSPTPAVPMSVAPRDTCSAVQGRHDDVVAYRLVCP